LQQLTLTQEIVIAVLALAGVVYGAWQTAKAAYRRADVDRLTSDAQARQALRDDMMQYIDELRSEVKALREENATLRQENATLRTRVRDLETELARICGERHEKGA